MITQINTTEKEQRVLVKSLLNPECYPHSVENVRMIETHISFVLLTGNYAYKLKKAVNLGFLDFTTLKLRHFFCQEELRLNRRLAPELYFDVIPISGTLQKPKVDTKLNILEFAVRMRQFPQQGLLNHVLACGELTVNHIDELATLVASFHQHIERARNNQNYGCASNIKLSMRQNFTQIQVMLDLPAEQDNLSKIETWSRTEHEALLPVFEQRHKNGFIRECHGDLHLGNIALVEEKIQIFDCIEFNPNLRWIDIMNETAFLVMDLDEHGRQDLAWRFLNAYLQETGDYEGLRLLRYYETYRAMVRAKVARIRASQLTLSVEDKKAALNAYSSYTKYARKITKAVNSGLIIINGLSGSGKTTVSQFLLENLGAIRIRSDIERKRLQKISLKKKSNSNVGAGIYSASATRDTYEELRRLANLILEAGYLVIIDAAFLLRWQRDLMLRLAEERSVPFMIISCLAKKDVLRRRLIQREYEGTDLSEATPEILAFQLKTQEPLDADENNHTIVFDSEQESINMLQQKVNNTLQFQWAQHSK